MANPKAPLRGVDVGVHLLVCVLLAGGLGYALDNWLSTKPLGLVVGGFLGFAAWLWMVWKMMGQKTPPAGPNNG